METIDSLTLMLDATALADAAASFASRSNPTAGAAPENLEADGADRRGVFALDRDLEPLAIVAHLLHKAADQHPIGVSGRQGAHLNVRGASHHEELGGGPQEHRLTHRLD